MINKSVLAADYITLPIQPAREAPVGLMVVGFSGEDERVLSVGLAIETSLSYQGPVLIG